MYTSVFIFILFVGTVIGADENQAKIRYYHGSMKNYTELYLDAAHEIVSTSWYDPSKPTVIITHGFTGYPEGPAMKAIILAYQAQGEYNIALLNWDRLAAMALPGLLNSYMNWAIPNSIKVGADFAETLVKLSSVGIDVNRMTFVGHSLGAHVFGSAGNRIKEKGVQLSCIIGLDPATGFDLKPSHLRLNPNSAVFTAALHTDPHKYGSKRELGLVNYWPNFKGFGSTVLQPGCSDSSSQRFSDDDFCSHNRSWKLWIEALQNPGTILGCHAKNFKVWNRYNKEQREANVLPLGVCDENALPGNYFFTTNSTSPYGLGKEGLCNNNC